MKDLQEASYQLPVEEIKQPESKRVANFAEV
jgi:hypothetical protein